MKVDPDIRLLIYRGLQSGYETIESLNEYYHPGDYTNEVKHMIDIGFIRINRDGLYKKTALGNEDFLQLRVEEFKEELLKTFSKRKLRMFIRRRAVNITNVKKIQESFRFRFHFNNERYKKIAADLLIQDIFNSLIRDNALVKVSGWRISKDGNDFIKRGKPQC